MLPRSKLRTKLSHLRKKLRTLLYLRAAFWKSKVNHFKAHKNILKMKKTNLCEIQQILVKKLDIWDRNLNMMMSLCKSCKSIQTIKVKMSRGLIKLLKSWLTTLEKSLIRELKFTYMIFKRICTICTLSLSEISLFKRYKNLV